MYYFHFIFLNSILILTKLDCWCHSVGFLICILKEFFLLTSYFCFISTETCVMDRFILLLIIHRKLSNTSASVRGQTQHLMALRYLPKKGKLKIHLEFIKLKFFCAITVRVSGKSLSILLCLWLTFERRKMMRH